MKSSVDHIFYFMHSRKHLTCFAIVFSCLLPILAGVSTAAEKNVTDTASPVAKQQKEEPFTYRVQDRKDPFVPFITEQATTSEINMNEIVETEAELTGMQLFEPGQLNLVALMKRGAEDFAMVEDFTGKGYVITKGTKIGRRGIVKEIAPNRVVIEETAETRAGQKIVTNTVMVLKKEGEE